MITAAAVISTYPPPQPHLEFPEQLKANFKIFIAFFWESSPNPEIRLGEAQ
jgi:hypothetical protein